MDRCRHRVSLLVSHPGGSFEDELLDQARPWFGSGSALEIVDLVVDVTLRDRYSDRAVEWRISAYVQAVEVQAA